jgi:DNA-binding response OmpR family regulator
LIAVVKNDTVLIIDDDANVRAFSARLLELEGYYVLQTDTDEEAFRLIGEEQVNLVILDFKLVEDNGWVILEKIKSDPEISAIPVIVFTASLGETQKGRALAMGASDYLVKSLSATSLRDAVARVLRRHS